MTKLIQEHKAKPWPMQRKRLQRYIDAHPMALCLASAEDIAYLKQEHFRGV